MATIYKTDGTQAEVEPANGTDFKLSELKPIVGGYVETVFFYDRKVKKVMVVNEEGKLRKLPVNAEATRFLMAIPGTLPDVIHGDALVCLSSQVR